MAVKSLFVVALAAVVGCGSGGSPKEALKPAALAAGAGSTKPGSSAPPTPPPPPPLAPTTMAVLVAGDLLPHRPHLVPPEKVTAGLAPLGDLFRGADATLANFEAATGDPARGPRVVGAVGMYVVGPEWLGAIKQSGVTMVTAANNHACDAGHVGLTDTLRAAQSAQLPLVGLDEKDPWRPRVLVERAGRKVCAVAWTTIVNSETGCGKDRRLARAGLNRAGHARVKAAIARAKKECDATVAVLHGGEEYVPQLENMREMARFAADSGADAVVMHHPHILSPLFVHETKDARRVPVYASVGNLLSNQGESYKPPMFPVLRENRRLVCVNGWTRLGMIARLTVRFAEGSRTPQLEWGYHLLWTDNEHADDKAAPAPKIATRLLDPSRDEAIIARLKDDERGPTAVFDDPAWIKP
jgi:poly-gamma-glutamate synthesis protein (capsule biosynthesis protein)